MSTDKIKSLSRFAVFLRTVLLMSLPGLSIIACGSSGLSSTQTATVPSPLISFPTATSSQITPAVNDTLVPSAIPSPPEPSNTKAVFKVAVIVDTLSEPVTREQAQVIFDEASGLVQPFAPVGLEMINFAEDGSGGATKDMADRYLASHNGTPANGILIFSFGDGGQAKLHDGYGYTLPAPAGYRNTFASPVGVANQVYIAVVHFGSRYMACGYGGTDKVQSATSIDGECRNKPGTACVQSNGYSMCANAVRNLYSTPPTHFVSSMIIHEFLHSFSPGGDKDNYATPECNARMGYPASFFDLQESEYYNGICPFVYQDFAASYQP
jgi:hypothetical protein